MISALRGGVAVGKVRRWQVRCGAVAKSKKDTARDAHGVAALTFVRSSEEPGCIQCQELSNQQVAQSNNGGIGIPILGSS